MAERSKVKGRAAHHQRPGGVGGWHQDPEGYVPTPGSASLSTLRRERRRRLLGARPTREEFDKDLKRSKKGRNIA